MFKSAKKFMNYLNNIQNNMNNKLENNFKNLNIKKPVYNIIILSDGRLCSCSSENINIYNKQNFDIDLQISDNYGFIFHTQLSNNNIISCCNDKTLKIYDIKNNKPYLLYTLIGHNKKVLKIIEIKNKQLISCSADKTMKIWEFKNNQYICINTLNISSKDETDTNILKINDNKLISSAYDDNIIKFWDIKNNFKEISTLNNIVVGSGRNSMIMFNDNILIIGGGFKLNGIYLINTDTYQLISQFHKNIIYVSSVIQLLNGNILIGCCEVGNKYSIIECKYENNNLIKLQSKEKAHTDCICGLIETNDRTIISCSSDNLIKFWA